uniref:Uncharacterized protein n=1 Tax=Cyprinus carpio carpio TaxID=630221 RepID=A0A8C1H8W9_CYPCA
MSSSSGPLTEELQCSICLDVFTDPVSTPCGHNFCKSCLNKCWDNSQTCSCPYCKEAFSQRPDLKINTTLRELVVTALKKHKLMDPVSNLEDYICQIHERPLELFCRDDQTCVCLMCHVTDHKNHKTVPLEEEGEEKKVEVTNKTAFKYVQQMIQERIEKIQDIKHSAEVRKNESQIFYDVLLLCVSTELKRMQQYAGTVSCLHYTRLHSHTHSFISNLCIVNFIRQNLPDNPERFDICIYVLGKNGFSSGRFYFEVQVKGNTEWDLGLVRESINRKGKIKLRPSDGYWIVGLRNGYKYGAFAGPSVSLCVRMKPQRVGVFVDYEKGLVSFYDVESSSHIYSFTGQSFTDKLYPILSPALKNKGQDSAPLIITSVNYNK